MHRAPGASSQSCAWTSPVPIISRGCRICGCLRESTGSNKKKRALNFFRCKKKKGAGEKGGKKPSPQKSIYFRKRISVNSFSASLRCKNFPGGTDSSPPGSSVHEDSPRQEYWSGLPFPSLGDLPNPGIEHMAPALAGRFFPLSH